jgi:hypothetical protein
MVRPATTSLRGGRLIYIKATGHSTMASENQVFVGNYPCIIPADGVTDTFISCETTDSFSTVDIYNLRVTLRSRGISVVTTHVQDFVHYQGAKTSQLVDIFPTSNFGGQAQAFFGVHKLSSLGDGRDMGDVRGLYLGNELCSRFDIDQPAISSEGNQYIKCSTSRSQ